MFFKCRPQSPPMPKKADGAGLRPPRRVHVGPMRLLYLQGAAGQEGQRRLLLPARRVRVGKLQSVHVSRTGRLRAARASATGDRESSGQPLQCAVDVRRPERRAPAERSTRRRPREETETVRPAPGGGPLRPGRRRRDRARQGVRRSQRDRQGRLPWPSAPRLPTRATAARCRRSSSRSAHRAAGPRSSPANESWWPDAWRPWPAPTRWRTSCAPGRRCRSRGTGEAQICAIGSAGSRCRARTTPRIGR